MEGIHSPPFFHLLKTNPMYKVLQNLPGYGYVIGCETKHISEKDATQFLKEKKIELIEEKKQAKK